jgi:hypothetical protein
VKSVIGIAHIPDCSTPVTDYSSVIALRTHPNYVISFGVNKSDEFRLTWFTVRPAPAIDTIPGRIFRIRIRCHDNDCREVFAKFSGLSWFRYYFPAIIKKMGYVCKPRIRQYFPHPLCYSSRKLTLKIDPGKLPDQLSRYRCVARLHVSPSARPLQFWVVFSQHPVPPNVRLWQGRRDAGVPLPEAF